MKIFFYPLKPEASETLLLPAEEDLTMHMLRACLLRRPPLLTEVMAGRSDPDLTRL
jgi:hypothetical protein